MKKLKFSWKKALLIAFCAVLLIIVARMYQKIDALTNQLTYMQDSTNVILSDMGNLQSNIEKTLQEEASMVEDYSITVDSLNFANNTCKVDISVVPKEYTDKTKVSIYFGTLECPLKRGKYAYTGTVDLPIEKNFDGNITFLLSNGRKKTTEVLNDYQGLDLNLDEVLSAKLEKAPTYRNGAIHLNSMCDVQLQGNGLFTFETLDLVTMLDDKRVNVTDLLAQMNGSDAQEGSNVPGGESVGATESSDADSIENGDTVESVSSAARASFVYEFPEADTEDTEAAIPETQHIRISVRAKTTEGYRFEYTVFEGDYLTLEEKLDRDNFRWNTANAAYDRNGNEMELEVHEINNDEN